MISPINDLNRSIMARMNGDLGEVPRLINIHFSKVFGIPLFQLDEWVDEMGEDKHMRWEWVFFYFLSCHRNPQFSVPTAILHAFEIVPFRSIPEIIGCFPIYQYVDIGLGPKGSNQADFDRAIEALELDVLLDFLADAVVEGLILRADVNGVNGIFPVVSNETLQLIDRFQFSHTWKRKYIEAIEKGLSRKGLERSSTNRRDSILSRLALLEVFCMDYYWTRQEELLRDFNLQHPDRVQLLCSALSNHMDSIPDDNELFDFIFAYTGGQVLPDDPRAWMKLFIKSVETGKVLIPTN